MEENKSESNIGFLKKFVQFAKTPEKTQSPEEKLLAMMEAQLQALNTNVSKEDFLKSFEEILRYVIAIEQKTSNEVEVLRQAYQMMSDKLSNETSKSLTDIKGQVNHAFVGDRVNKIEQDLHSKVDNKLSTVKNGVNGLDGKNGRDGRSGKDGKDGFNGKNGKDGKNGTNGKDGRSSGGGIVGRDLIKDIDLSSQLNGVLTTFNLPVVWNIVSVSLSSYPYGTLRKNIDYSFTPTSITFLGTIDPTTQLSVGQQCVLTVVSG